MLILLATAEGEEAPVLPDLRIQDAESLENIPVAGLEGWDNDFIQTQALCYAPMSFSEEEADLGATAETGKYWCRRLSRILLRVSLTSAGANTVVRPLYYDQNGKETIGPALTLNATARQEGSNYMAQMEVIHTYGANKVAFEVESVSAGLVNITIAGV